MGVLPSDILFWRVFLANFQPLSFSTQQIIEKEGVTGLMGRGLGTKLISNGMQVQILGQTRRRIFEPCMVVGGGGGVLCTIHGVQALCSAVV